MKRNSIAVCVCYLQICVYSKRVLHTRTHTHAHNQRHSIYSVSFVVINTKLRHYILRYHVLVESVYRLYRCIPSWCRLLSFPSSCVYVLFLRSSLSLVNIVLFNWC